MSNMPTTQTLSTEGYLTNLQQVTSPFDTFAMPSAGETAERVAKSVADRTGQATRMLALATVLAGGAVVNQSCEIKPTEQVEPVDPYKNLGEIIDIPVQNAPGVKAEGYKGTNGLMVITKISINLLDGNPANDKYIRSVKNFFVQTVPGFENREVDSITMEEMDNYIKGEHYDQLGKLIEWNWMFGASVTTSNDVKASRHIIKVTSIQDLFKVELDYLTHIVNGPDWANAFVEKTVTKNGESFTIKDRKGGAIGGKLSFSPGGSPFSITANANPIKFETTY